MNITRTIAALARQRPHVPAVLTNDGELSFAELDRAIAWTAGQFRRAGLTSGDIVALSVQSQLQDLIASLALARIGAGHVSFGPNDPRSLRSELAGRLGVSAVVGKRGNDANARYAAVEPPSDDIRDYKNLDSVDEPIVEDGSLPFLAVRTSGTTGVPKIGMITQKLAASRMVPQIFDRPGRRLLSSVDVRFTGAKQNIYRLLLSGGTLAFFDVENTQNVVDVIARHGITYFSGTPAYAAALLQMAVPNRMLLPQLEILRLSSTLVPDPLRQNILRSLTPNLYVAFGITEIGIVTVATPQQVRQTAGTVGRPLPERAAEIIDDNEIPLPIGSVGRLRLKSPGMIDGYDGDPAATSEVFRDGWYYTGDSAEFTQDGQIVHHGRADEMMILDGINIHPSEIENILLRHPAVVEAAAFAVASEVRRDIPVAAVVVNAPVPAAELIRHCQDWLGVKSPRKLMKMEALPRNPVGKVQKNELKRIFIEQLRAENRRR